MRITLLVIFLLSTLFSETTLCYKNNMQESIINKTIKLDGGQIIKGHVSGKMRMHMIKVLPGDRVIIQMTPYDLTKGRIVKRT